MNPGFKLRKQSKIHRAEQGSSGGFTLVEISIVIVIIGLIAGAILVGRDLIKASTIRAQVSQITELNTAVNTFRVKYNYLPGDMPQTEATNAGLIRAGTYCETNHSGCGNGDGKIGITESTPTGEEHLFWLDLNTAGFIHGSFIIPAGSNTDTQTDGTSVANYLPPAKLGGNEYIYAYNGDKSIWRIASSANYFSLSGITRFCGYNYCGNFAQGIPNISVTDAYNIDQKMDDGLPTSGSVTAFFVGFQPGYGGAIIWASYTGNNYLPSPPTSATAGNSTTCFDNDNVGGATQKYSLKYNGGNNHTCALSFKFP